MLNTISTTQFGLDTCSLPQYDGYQITRKLGIGAASTIYEVRHQVTGQTRALKHVIRKDGEDKRMIEQVENEFEIARKVDHPYIRKVHEIKKIKRRLQVREVFMLMDCCPGISLERSPRRSLIDLLLIFHMVADGINAMHSVGLLHCDVKPNNIIISKNGEICVIDLGQSCPLGTVKPRIQGTPDYIAPEQVKRRPLSRCTDVFNLGATIYWALTGKNIPTMIPKKNDRLELVSSGTVDAPISPHLLKPQIPVGVSNLVMECVSKTPSNRPADMSALIARLDMLIYMLTGGKLRETQTNNRIRRVCRWRHNRDPGWSLPVSG